MEVFSGACFYVFFEFFRASWTMKKRNAVVKDSRFFVVRVICFQNKDYTLVNSDLFPIFRYLFNFRYYFGTRSFKKNPLEILLAGSLFMALKMNKTIQRAKIEIGHSVR